MNDTTPDTLPGSVAWLGYGGLLPFLGVATVLAALFVLDVKVPKPRGIAYAGFGLLAVIVVALLWIVRL